MVLIKKKILKNLLKKSHDHHNKVYMKLYNKDHVVAPVVGDYYICLGIDLKVVSITFLLVCFLSLNESTFQTRKNVFCFT